MLIPFRYTAEGMKIKTLLILGAGASYGYGFPLGWELREMILASLLNPLADDIGRALIAAGFEIDRLRDFRDHFFKSGTPSIDSFIQEWEEWEKEGKAAIAAILLHKEQASQRRLFETSTSSWYRRLLWGIQGSENLHSDKLSIITFNYDRSLEHYLLTALPAARKIDRTELERRIKNLEILHFYGDLGSIWEDRANDVIYGLFSSERVLRAAKSIHLIGRSEAAQAASERAIQLVRQAQRIVFMGFGYDRENLKRLGFDGTGLWSPSARSPHLDCIMHSITPVAKGRIEPAFAGYSYQLLEKTTIDSYLDSRDIFA